MSVHRKGAIPFGRAEALAKRVKCSIGQHGGLVVFPVSKTALTSIMLQKKSQVSAVRD
jgi:hypothetical protein